MNERGRAAPVRHRPPAQGVARRPHDLRRGARPRAGLAARGGRREAAAHLAHPGGGHDPLAVDAPRFVCGTCVDAVRRDRGHAARRGVVIGAREPIGVVLLSTLREFVRRRELQKMLIADDVVQRAPIVASGSR